MGRILQFILGFIRGLLGKPRKDDSDDKND